MGSCVVQIGCMAFGVLVLILVTVCCARPNWMMVSYTFVNVGAATGRMGLWKSCGDVVGQQMCMDYESLPNLDSDLQTIRAMTVISCLLTYLSFLILLILGFCPSLVTSLQNEDTKPKVRLGVGVGLLLAGLLLIISVSWFPHIVEKNVKSLIPGDSFIKMISIGSFETSKGEGIYVGGAAGGLLLLGGGLLILFRKKDIP